MWKYAEYVYVNLDKWNSIYWLLFDIIIHAIKIITSHLFLESIPLLFQNYVKEGGRSEGMDGREVGQGREVE